jgi:hypothetical protein
VKTLDDYLNYPELANEPSVFRGNDYEVTSEDAQQDKKAQKFVEAIEDSPLATPGRKYNMEAQAVRP